MRLLEDDVETVVKIVAVVALVIGLSLLTAYPTMWIVNWLFAPGLLVGVFGMAKIGVWQAFWLNFLCGWMLKSWNWNSSKK